MIYIIYTDAIGTEIFQYIVYQQVVTTTRMLIVSIIKVYVMLHPLTNKVSVIVLFSPPLLINFIVNSSLGCVLSM